MSHQMSLTTAEMEIAVSALEILSPDDADAQEIAREFEIDIRERLDELDDDRREEISAEEEAGGPLYSVNFYADAEQWIALADGLDVINPDEDEMADLAAELSERVRSVLHVSTPSL